MIEVRLQGYHLSIPLLLQLHLEGVHQAEEPLQWTTTSKEVVSFKQNPKVFTLTIIWGNNRLGDIIRVE